MAHTLDTENYRGYTIEKNVDPDPISPRKNSFGVIAGTHPEYNVPDDPAEGGFEPSGTQSFYERLAVRAGLNLEMVRKVRDWLYQRKGGYENHELAVDTVERYYDRRLQKAVDENFLVLPVFIYEHSQINLSVSNDRYPFNSRWDAGQIGWVFVSHEKVEETYGEANSEAFEKAREVLKAEVEQYGSYLNGDVYGYRVKNQKGETVNVPRYGFYDMDRMIEEARAEIDDLNSKGKAAAE